MEKDSEEKVKWQVTGNRFVACLDLLGFKEYVAGHTHSQVFEKLVALSEIKKATVDAAKEKAIVDLFNDVEVEVVSFSDSIFIFSNKDDINTFEFFLVAVRYIFIHALNSDLPMKGAIAYGQISLELEEQIFFGQPIIDAHLLQEDVNYLGIVAHHSVDQYLDDMKEEVEKSKYFPKLLFSEKTPLKSGNITHTNLNWFTFNKYTNGVDSASEDLVRFLSRFRLTATGSPRRYSENTIDLLKLGEKNKTINLGKIR